MCLTVEFSSHEPRYRYDSLNGLCIIPTRHQKRLETLNEIMKRVFNTFALERKVGFLFHASFLVGHEISLLLTGPSGSGKSTLTKKLSPFFRCGNDDLTLVCPHDGMLEAHSTPFCNWQKTKESGLPFPLSSPVSLILILEKEIESPSSIHPIADKDTIWRYLIKNHQVFFPKGSEKSTTTLHRYLNEFVGNGCFFTVRHNLNDPPEKVYDLIRSAQ